MNAASSQKSPLATFIRENIGTILDYWDQFAKSIPSAHELDNKQLHDHCIGILHAIAADLDTPQTSAEQTEKSLGHAPHAAPTSEAELHGAGRVVHGFNVSDAVSEFRALRASVLRLWSATNAEGELPRMRDVTRFNEAIDQALAESLQRYAYEKAHLTQLFDTLLSSSPDLNFIFDKDGALIYANHAFVEQFNLANKNIVNTNIFTLFPVGAQELRQHAW